MPCCARDSLTHTQPPWEPVCGGGMEAEFSVPRAQVTRRPHGGQLPKLALNFGNPDDQGGYEAAGYTATWHPQLPIPQALEPHTLHTPLTAPTGLRVVICQECPLSAVLHPVSKGSWKSCRREECREEHTVLPHTQKGWAAATVPLHDLGFKFKKNDSSIHLSSLPSCFC